MSSRCTAAALLSFALISTASAQEWARFRGPNGTGLGDAKGLPPQVTMADYEWIVDLGGSGVSSPVLWEKHIFVTSADANAPDSRRLHCLNAETGEKVWEWVDKFTVHHQHKFNSFASATPVVDAQGIYLVWGSGDKNIAVALDHQGKVRWTKDWPNLSSDHGVASSPILVGQVLVVQSEHKDLGTSAIHGLNKETGEEIWKHERANPPASDKQKSAYSTPVLVLPKGAEASKEILVVVNTTHGVEGLDPQTGKSLWQYNPGFGQRSVGSPIVIEGGTLALTLGSGGGGKEFAVLRINADAPPTPLYELPKKAMPYVPTPIAGDGLLYLWGDGGVLTALDAESGKEVYQERAGEGTFFSSPVIADGKIFCGSRDGVLVAVKAGPKFELLGSSKLDAGIHGTPAVALGRLFIRTDTHLISIKGK